MVEVFQWDDHIRAAGITVNFGVEFSMACVPPFVDQLSDATHRTFNLSNPI